MNKNNIKKISIVVIIFVVTILGLHFLAPTPYNSKTKLDIVSAYGDNEAYHPKVLNFKEPWNGYKYWMSYTPYPKGDESKENPHVVASNNLIKWETPNGLINPLDDIKDDGEPKKYDSDSHLVYNDSLDRIECYWRYVNDVDNEVIIYRKYTNDGIHFSEKEVFLKSKDRKSRDYVSPAILLQDGKYKVWYVDKKKVQYTESSDGKTWSEPVVISIKYKDSKNLKTWHLDVISTEKGYEMIMVAYEDVNARNKMKLYYSQSTSETKGWSKAVKIISPKSGSLFWDNLGLYRSAFVYEDGVYIVFYSGISTKDDHGIGIMYGKDIQKLKSVNIDFSKNKDSDQMLKLIKKERK